LTLNLTLTLAPIQAALAASGVPFTVLRPNLFMHMLAGEGFLGLGLDEQVRGRGRLL
jgi:uncharacterized protein YbjT (DUF2867 family)